MNYDDTSIPDFSSVLSGGDESNHESQLETVVPYISIKTKDIPDIMENQPEIESESEEEVLDASSEEEMDESGSEAGLQPLESESESESESGSESESESESELESECESETEFEAESEDDASESDDDSDDETSTSSSKDIEIGGCDESDGDAEHVYEEGGVEGEEEVCYEGTDLGGEKVEAASLLAASILAGGGAVRSGTGWTWTSIFIVLTAAGGLGIVLLYAIKRINDLTRLVKMLEENSHMAMNERDVQVITTQVIGDMLEDTEDSGNPNIETTDPVQTEFDNFVASGNQEVNQQSISELLKNDDENDDVDIDDDDDKAKKVEGVFAKENKDEKGEEDTTLVVVEDEQAEEESTVVVVEDEKGEEDSTVVVVQDEKGEEDSTVVVVQDEKGESEKEDETGYEDATRADVPEKKGAVRSDSESPLVAEDVVIESDKNDPESDVDDLVVMVKTLSLSDDLGSEKEPSRLTRSKKRVRSV